jgi:ubiquitin-large subunit ribosomal protein L40e
VNVFHAYSRLNQNISFFKDRLPELSSKQKLITVIAISIIGYWLVCLTLYRCWRNCQVKCIDKMKEGNDLQIGKTKIESPILQKDPSSPIKERKKESEGISPPKQEQEHEQNKLEIPDDEESHLVEETQEIQKDLADPKNKKFQIFVRNLMGQTETFDVSNNETILSLKQAIQEKDGIHVDQMRLIFAGMQLENDKTFEHYNIQKESTFHLCAYLRGD